MTDIQQQIAGAIWTELERQQVEQPNGHMFVEPDIGLIDGGVDMSAVAEAVLSELGLTAEWALSRGTGTAVVMPEQAARVNAARRPESNHVLSRWVSRWVEQ